MAIPGFQKMLWPLLELLDDNVSFSVDAAADALVDRFGLLDNERREGTSPDGDSIFEFRLRWAIRNLASAGLIENVPEDVARITKTGSDVAAKFVVKNDRQWLRRFVLNEADREFKSRCIRTEIPQSPHNDPMASRDKVLQMFLGQIGRAIDGVELDRLSDTNDYRGIVRELRIERGFRILSGASPDEESGVQLKPDQYLLTSEHVDSDLARRWHVANRIRKGSAGAKAKILQFLKENVGKVVTTEELAYVSGDKSEFGRRTRELRTEEGYAVATRFTGRPDLNAGEYVLLSIERVAEPHDRHIPSDVQRAVYERDNSTCRHCGWNMSMWTVTDPRILELHHVTAHAKRGSNDLENLIVLCSFCHDDVHAGRIKLRKKST